MNIMKTLDRWLESRFGGHIAFKLFDHSVTIYGFNAMHVAVNVWTDRWGYVCFHPPMRVFGRWWPWYFYVSRNATPESATFAIGPGVGERCARMARRRRALFGHGPIPSNGNEIIEATYSDSDDVAEIRKDGTK